MVRFKFASRTWRASTRIRLSVFPSVHMVRAIGRACAVVTLPAGKVAAPRQALACAPRGVRRAVEVSG
jgi:hypothetical protein